MKTATPVKERLQWFQVLSSFYEIASPYIEIFTGIKCQALENQTVETDLIEDNAFVLRQLLYLIKNLPEPANTELSRTKTYFETALTNCVNGSAALVKYVKMDAKSAEGQVQLDILVNSVVLAREYIESIHMRLHLVPEKSDH